MMMMMHHHHPELGGRSGGRAVMQMECRAHHLIEEVLVFPWAPHLPSPAAYSPQMAPVAARVHCCGAKNEGHVICDQIPLHAIGRGASALQASSTLERSML